MNKDLNENNEPIIDIDEPLIKPFMIKEDSKGRSVVASWDDLLLKEQLVSGIVAKGFTYPS